ncbi:TPA: hypothetical protein KB475_002068 [Escherichia coli]|nr:hypothetical protein [Escherichia coli]
MPIDGFFSQRRSVLVETFAILANCSNVIAFMSTSTLKDAASRGKKDEIRKFLEAVDSHSLNQFPM